MMQSSRTRRRNHQRSLRVQDPNLNRCPGRILDCNFARMKSIRRLSVCHRRTCRSKCREGRTIDEIGTDRIEQNKILSMD
uniref:Uncharacterized protein n=1 Tax=Setaria viridis TaxID=4556 RepID=A0A4U6T2Y8_SETVI|nr:hypothetical protein SEVIR_9G075866v2 [Setaria viridis]